MSVHAQKLKNNAIFKQKYTNNCLQLLTNGLFLLFQLQGKSVLKHQLQVVKVYYQYVEETKLDLKPNTVGQCLKVNQDPM